MGTTQLDQYKAALRAIGDQRLHSLTEAVAARFVLDDVWSSSIEYMLAQAGWKFAIKVLELSHDTAITSQFGAQYAMSIPSDLVRLTGISIDGNFWSDLPDFDEHDGHWWTNYDPIYIKFVSKDALYGLDLSKWPVDFAKAHAFYLALDSGLQITKSGTTKDSLYGDHMRSLNRSKTLDAIKSAVKQKPKGTWVRSRFAGGLISGQRDDNLQQ